MKIGRLKLSLLRLTLLLHKRMTKRKRNNIDQTVKHRKSNPPPIYIVQITIFNANLLRRISATSLNEEKVCQYLHKNIDKEIKNNVVSNGAHIRMVW